MLIAGIGISNTLISFINQKNVSIAIMKSIGFKSRDIKQIFYIEILLLLFFITSLAYVMSLLIIPQANHFITNLGLSLESQFNFYNYGLILMTGFLVVIIFCIPSDAFREVSNLASNYVKEESFLVTATKGVEKDGFSLMSNILAEYFPGNAIGVLSGPNLAEEIASKHLSGTVIASENKILVQTIIESLSTEFFRVYENDDPYGVEMGGALKNIYAIACGIADGLDSGENTVGMIMTRGLGEMGRLASELAANPQTFLRLAGVGDLITTCASPLSRNHQFGKLIGKGMTVDDAKTQIGQTIEGLKTLRVVKIISDEHKVKMPIVDSLYKIIYKGNSLDGSIQNVLGQDMIKDVEFIK